MEGVGGRKIRFIRVPFYYRRYSTLLPAHNQKKTTDKTDFADLYGLIIFNLIICMDKKPKKNLYKVLLVLMLFIFVFINYHVKYTANKRCYKNEKNLPAVQVGIVFGAGLRNGGPSKYLQDRLDAAINLYDNHKIQKILLSGDNG